MILCGGSSNGSRNGNSGKGTMVGQICAQWQSGGVRAPQQRCSDDGRWRLLKVVAEAEMAVVADILLSSSSVIIVGDVFALLLYSSTVGIVLRGIL
jgi:hypothetical protein